MQKRYKTHTEDLCSHSAKRTLVVNLLDKYRGLTLSEMSHELKISKYEMSTILDFLVDRDYLYSKESFAEEGAFVRRYYNACVL